MYHLILVPSHFCLDSSLSLRTFSGGRVLLDDDTDLGYVEDGTPCGPSMMCLERKCVPISSLNLTACPSGPNGRVCSSYGVSHKIEHACHTFFSSPVKLIYESVW